MAIAIKTEGLGKQYPILHEKGPRYATLRDTLANMLFSLGRRRVKKEQEIFWALHDVDLEIREGERVGIIGRNGAGKSTLLKLLSRITEPSSGKIHLHGRVSSLLEVGTGFHPELSGRENIFLNGAILGMSRAEIQQRFDDIVEFSGVARFLDTPVKRYSSGMYTRLAFAVSAHLEPDIMLVDEVLAVGDAEFQKKCLTKMGDVAESGRTVLFVSHNMSAVEQLCDRVLWVDDGRVVEDDRDVRSCIRRYLAGGTSVQLPRWTREDDRFDNASFVPLDFYLVDAGGKRMNAFVSNDEDVRVVVEFDLKQLDPALCIGLALYSAEGEPFYWSYQTDGEESSWPQLSMGFNRLCASLPRHLLNEGDYRIQMIAGLHFREWYLQPGHDGPAFSVTVRGGLSLSPYWRNARPGLLAPVLSWQQDLPGDNGMAGA